MEQIDRQAYLKCKVTGDFLSSPIIGFESFYFGYPAGECVVDESHLKNIEGNSALVKLMDNPCPCTKEYKEKDSFINKNLNEEDYVFIKINSILDLGWAHFLVPKKNIVYLEN